MLSFVIIIILVYSILCTVDGLPSTCSWTSSEGLINVLRFDREQNKTITTTETKATTTITIKRTLVIVPITTGASWDVLVIILRVEDGAVV